MRRKDYYMVLGVSRGESPSGIREAFRDLVRRYHPDRVGAQGLRFFQEIVEAYRMLADPERRRDYDRGLADATPRSDDPDGGPIVLDTRSASLLPQVIPPLRCAPRGYTAFQAAFARVVRDLSAPAARPTGDWQSIDLQAVLSPDEAARGGLASLSVPSWIPCQACGGSGREQSFECEACDGAGLLENEERLRIFVPPPVADATLVEVPLRGLGVHHFYLRVRLRVAAETTPAPASTATGHS